MRLETLRESQRERLVEAAAALAGLSDNDLEEVSFTVTMGHAVIMKRLDSTHQIGDPYSPAVMAVGTLRDIIVDETNHRLGVIWNSRADLNGGHLPIVSLEDVDGTWSACCSPDFDAEAHWSGPDRATFEEALADSKAHCPVEPEIYGGLES